jgi:hypothetical protein
MVSGHLLSLTIMTLIFRFEKLRFCYDRSQISTSISALTARSGIVFFAVVSAIYPGLKSPATTTFAFAPLSKVCEIFYLRSNPVVWYPRHISSSTLVPLCDPAGVPASHVPVAHWLLCVHVQAVQLFPFDAIHT